jgi:hypothetical protein
MKAPLRLIPSGAFSTGEYMLTTELIKKLQQMIEEHKPYEEVMGPHEVVIDVFKRDGVTDHGFHYAGFSPYIEIEKSSDGVYDILSAFAESQPPR